LVLDQHPPQRLHVGRNSLHDAFLFRRVGNRNFDGTIQSQLTISDLFQSTHGLSPFYAGLIFAAILMCGTVFQPLFGKYSDSRGRKPLILLMLFGASFFALVAGISDSLMWALLGLAPSVAILTAVRPVILAAAVEYSGKSEATTLGVVFTVLDGVGMFGALLAGLIAEFELAYAFIAAAAMALVAGTIAVFLSLSSGRPDPDHAVISQVASPADP